MHVILDILGATVLFLTFARVRKRRISGPFTKITKASVFNG